MPNGRFKSQFSPNVNALAISLAIGAVFLPAPNSAASLDTPAKITAGLKPETLKTVRSVGQAVLRAKRSYVREQDVVLRDAIERMRRQLESLTVPTASVPSLQVQSIQAPVADPQIQSVSQESAWQQARAAKVSELRQTIVGVRAQARGLRAKLKKAAKTSAISPVTSAALVRFEQLTTEIDEVLALPAVERQTRLQALAAEFRLGVSQTHETENNSATATPTFSTRTRHRSAGKENQRASP